MDYGLAYFTVDSGEHTIEIVYEDNYEMAIRVVYTVYYITFAVVGLSYLFAFVAKGKRKCK